MCRSMSLSFYLVSIVAQMIRRSLRPAWRTSSASWRTTMSARTRRRRSSPCCVSAGCTRSSVSYTHLEHPRAILLQKYSITVDENEKFKFSGGGENHVNCLFRHIRNSFAHGNTYFFDNGNVLLEDKDNSKITAAILIKQQTLLDWIRVIDKEEQFYTLVDVCAKCKTETEE